MNSSQNVLDVGSRHTFYTSLNPTLLNQLQELEAQWQRMLSLPTWYLTVIPEIQAFMDGLREETASRQTACKQALYEFFELHLSAGNFALGRGMGEADAQRTPIDTIVIHHTSNPPGLSAARLSAIELMRLYGSYFANPPETYKHLKGKPIFSGHERDGKQVFWPYHWLIRNDGHAERLLSDSEIGWHAGNWDINCRSIAIALDNDYEKGRPSDLVLRAVAALIVNRYEQVPIPRVLGHREVNERTTCPSELFLSGPAGNGWKNDLNRKLAQYRDDPANRT
jgi:hypothetical protein